VKYKNVKDVSEKDIIEGHVLSTSIIEIWTYV